MSALPSLGCQKDARSAPTKPAPVTSSAISIIGTGELRGTTEPCGCNSDPLGDLARTVALAKDGLLVDAGDLLFESGGASAGRQAQADRKADAINAIYGKAGAEMGLGPNDLQGWRSHPGPPRDACNVTFGSLVAPHVREVRGLRIGIFGAVDQKRFEAAVRLLPWRASPMPTQDPIEKSREAVATITKDRPEIVVALLAMTREEARALLQSVPGIDFAIVGIDVVGEEGMAEPEPVGDAWLVAPADQGRRVVKLDVVRGNAPAGTRLKPQRWDGESGRARELARIDRRTQTLKDQLESWRTDKTADPTFVAARRQELDGLVAERARTVAATIRPPQPPYFTYTLLPIRKNLPRDANVAAALRELAHKNGLANLADAQKVAPPVAAKGQPRYVGETACVRCHKAAAAFWAKTRHASAWKTLVDVDKQYDYDCIGCHVTGFDAPGGSNLGSAEKQGLVNVQCEVCHGAGSRHVEEAGLDDPPTITTAPAADFCRTRCHTKEHSDTFVLDPYLRDILGPGHGEARRKALGEGPTGHELRQKALAAAQR
jgi:hypothetical protein